MVALDVYSQMPTERRRVPLVHTIGRSLDSNLVPAKSEKEYAMVDARRDVTATVLCS